MRIVDLFRAHVLKHATGAINANEYQLAHDIASVKNTNVMKEHRALTLKIADLKAKAAESHSIFRRIYLWLVQKAEARQEILQFKFNKNRNHMIRSAIELDKEAERKGQLPTELLAPVVTRFADMPLGNRDITFNDLEMAKTLLQDITPVKLTDLTTANVTSKLHQLLRDRLDILNSRAIINARLHIEIDKRVKDNDLIDNLTEQVLDATEKLITNNDDLTRILNDLTDIANGLERNALRERKLMQQVEQELTRIHNYRMYNSAVEEAAGAELVSLAKNLYDTNVDISIL